jgi:endonuclease/exonuclease/phosphatase family metal-dependent hydrolase
MTESRASKIPSTLRVVTMNVYGRRADWPARRAVLAAGLGTLAPDLVALQETVVTDTYDQVTDLLGEGYHVVHQQRREADGVGMSLAARWPLDDVEELDLLETGRTRREEFLAAMLAATVQVPDPFGRVVLASPVPSFRLGLEIERERQAVLAARRLEEIAAASGGHVVIASDFSSAPDTAGMRFWAGLQSLDGTSVAYRDAWDTIHPGASGPTFSPANPLVTGGNWPLELGRRMDYILVRCDEHGPTLRIADCRRIFDEPVDDVWASDHFGVMAELEPLD